MERIADPAERTNFVAAVGGKDFANEVAKAAQGNDPIATQVIFAGFDPRGSPVFSNTGVMITVDSRLTVSPRLGPVLHGDTLDTAGAPRIDGFALGYSAWQELKKQESSQSIKHKSLVKQLNSARSEKGKKAAINTFTELVGSWHPSDVGGPTDIVSLRPNGMKWLQIKEMCRR